MKKKRILISGVLLIALLSGLLFPISNNGLQNVVAASRLHGVQQIVNTMGKDDPFVILEVVPDEAYSSLGYYVDGTQPTISAKVMQGTVNTNAEVLEEECTSKAERKDKIKQYLAAIASESGVISYKDSSFYIEQLFASDSLMLGWEKLEAPQGEYFYEYRVGYYEKAEKYFIDEGSYKRVETPAEDGTDNLVVTYEYAPEGGEYIWVDDEVNGKKEFVQFDTLYYYTALQSNDWFAKDVLETEASTNVVVISLTASQLENKLMSGDISEGNLAIDVTLNEVDLVYLSNSSCLNYAEDDYELLDTYAINTGESESGENDISWLTAYSVYEYVINANLPVVVDETIISSALSHSQDMKALLAADNNMIRLAYLLENYTTTTTLETYSLNSDPQVWTAELIDNLIEATEKKSMGIAGCINGSVYVNKSGNNLVNAEWANTDIYNSSKVEDKDINSVIAGMSEVVNEIKQENYYNDVQGRDRTVEYDINNVVHVSQATLVKYILNHGYRRVPLVKDTITVLDIEPTKYSTLTEDKVRGWIQGTASENMLNEIKIVQMPIYEFIGKEDDLKENYDLIYFGSCVGPQDGVGSLKVDENGFIYTSAGDLVSGSSNGERYAGNDITAEKLSNLKGFVDAGYPVVVDGKFINENGTVAYIQSDSKMYDFLSYAKTKNNFVNESSFDKDVLVDYLNMPKLHLSMISEPTEYTVVYNNYDENYDKFLPFYAIREATYLESVDGKYSLEYVFKFSDSSGTLDEFTKYKVQLYVDTNGNGRYEATEELDSLLVTEKDSKTQVSADALESGILYHVKRELPDNYRGAIPWKLVVSKVETKNTESGVVSNVIVKASETGFSAVKVDRDEDDDSDNYVQINVLQLVANGTSKYFKLEKDDEFQKKLFPNVKNVAGYDIIAKTEEVSEYRTAYKPYASTDNEPNVSAFYQEHLQNYDVLIVGFTEEFNELDAGEIKAIKMFVDSGRPVIFNYDTSVNWKADIRNLLGMQQGASDITLDLANGKITSAETYVSSVTQINEGPITSYPYSWNIDSQDNSGSENENGYSVAVREKEMINYYFETNNNYHRLDVGSNSDAIVWYCLADDAYDAKPNDVRNNAYLYSVGNVTHIRMSCLIGGKQTGRYFRGEEAQLLINAIISSYNAGVSKPKVSVVADENNKDTSLEYIYRTYDEEINHVDTTDENIYFYVTDNNIIDGRKLINVNYYCLAKSGEQADATYAGNNLKIIEDITTTTGEIKSNEIQRAMLDSEWINNQLKDKNEVTIYIGAQTKLDYNKKADIDTEKYFTSITIKKRDLINLD